MKGLFPGSSPASPDIGAFKRNMFISHDPYQAFSVQNERQHFTWKKLTIKNNPSIEGETSLLYDVVIRNHSYSIVIIEDLPEFGSLVINQGSS